MPIVPEIRYPGSIVSNRLYSTRFAENAQAVTSSYPGAIPCAPPRGSASSQHSSLAGHSLVIPDDRLDRSILIIVLARQEVQSESVV